MIKKYLPEISKPTRQQKMLAYGVIVVMACLIFMSMQSGLEWGGNLPLIFSAFSSGIILNLYGVSVAKGIKNVFWIILFSVPLYTVSIGLSSLINS